MQNILQLQKQQKILNDTTNNSTLISELNLTRTTCLIKYRLLIKTDKWKANKKSRRTKCTMNKTVTGKEYHDQKIYH